MTGATPTGSGSQATPEAAKASSPSASIPSAGQLYTVAYPFVADTYEGQDADGPFSAFSWKPGIRHEWISPEDTAPVADGQGLMQLMVVDAFKPGRFPTRVFYTRSWVDPDGNTFGKGGLRITTLERFRRISRGYQHPYGLGKPDSDAPHSAAESRAFFEREIASAIEARRAETGTGSVHESAVAKPDAQTPDLSPTKGQGL